MTRSGFGEFAAEYHRFRPGYPAELWDMLLEGPTSRAVDLGCGTGRALLELARREISVVGVEPDPGMVEQARLAALREGARVWLVVARAESTGLATGCADLVFAAQAFHWFEAPQALREVQRILSPGGRLAFWWNNRDTATTPWLQEYEDLIRHYNPSWPRAYRARDWKALLKAEPRFTEPISRTWSFHVPASRASFLGFSRTVSYIRNALSAPQLRAFESDLDALLRRHHGAEPFQVPYQTQLFMAETLSQD